MDHAHPKILRRFRYINQPVGKNYRESEVLENIYTTITDLEDKFVVGEEKNGYFNYLVFSSYQDYNVFLDSIEPKNRNFHEIIFGLLPQKIKIDIDATSDLIGEQEINDFLKDLDEHIIDLFWISYGYHISTDNIVTTTSSGLSGNVYKFSYHKIIKGYYVVNNDEVDQFTKNLLRIVQPKYKRFIDDKVNKNVQNFRLVGCCKYGSDRFKMIIDNEKHDPKDTIIRHIVNCTQLPAKVKKKNIQTQFDIAEEDLNNILEMAKDHTDGFKYRKTIGEGASKLLCFTRQHASWCHICKETHHRDNHLMISVYVKDNIGKVSVKCRHQPKESIYLGEFIPINLEPAGGSSDKPNTNDFLDKIIAKYIDNPPNICDYKSFKDLPDEQKNIYSDKYMHEIEHRDTVCIKANMKMGKTKQLVKYIDQYYQDADLTQHKIIFVSFRQTFSSNIKEKFPSYTIYSDVRGELTQNKLIVQVESLHRIKIDPAKDIDLLVLDESESIFEQFSSGLNKNFNRSWANFQYIINNAKNVICMDAHLSDRTFNMLKHMRIDKENKYNQKREIFFHHNQYQNCTDDTFHITRNKTNWYAKLYHDISVGNVVAVPINSLNEAKIIERNIKNRFPECRVGIYSGETPYSTKREHFSNVDEYWSEYDVVIFTPTVTAGVSFERSHYDKIYALFTDVSCGVETCMQMLYRVRDISQYEYNICLDVHGNGLPTDTEKIKELLYYSRENLFRDFDSSQLSYEYDIKGEIKYYNTDYFELWLQNMKFTNMSKNSFAKRFINYLHIMGCVLNILEFETDDEQNIKAENKAINKEIKIEKRESVATAKDLNMEELIQLQEKLVDTNNDIEMSERFSYERYKLRRDYNWSGKIDTEFATKYMDTKTIRHFKNVKRILHEEDVEESLNKIKEEEKQHYIRTMNLDSSYQDLDVHRRYVYDHHRVAIGILKCLGWDNIDDPSYNYFEELFQNIRINDRKLYSTLKDHYSYYHMKPPSLKCLIYREKYKPEDYVKGVLKYVNKAINYMYGVRVIQDKKNEELFKLSEITAFYTKKNIRFKDKPNIWNETWSPKAREIKYETSVDDDDEEAYKASERQLEDFLNYEY